MYLLAHGDGGLGIALLTVNERGSLVVEAVQSVGLLVDKVAAP